jgi:diguanylate cyclase (GGDEF)-like protein
MKSANPSISLIREVSGASTMISLKKHIDSYEKQLQRVVIDCYRETVVAMGAAASRALPALGSDFNRSLNALASGISRNATPAGITATNQTLVSELDRWGEKGVGYFAEKTKEVKEIMTAVASALEAVGARDQRFGVRLNEFTAQLGEIAHLEDVSAARKALLQSAGQLTSYIATMAEEGRDATARLRAEVDAYRNRLQEAERQGASDTVTGLANRAACEIALVEQVSKKEEFCVLFLDLNGFKSINDRYGHLAGDSLLRKFSQELRAQIRPTDLASRWGGDEFVCILKCSIAQVADYRDRISNWAFGEYKLDAGSNNQKVVLSAAMGFAQWNRSETVKELVARADAAMYEDKTSAR